MSLIILSKDLSKTFYHITVERICTRHWPYYSLTSMKHLHQENTIIFVSHVTIVIHANHIKFWVPLKSSNLVFSSFTTSCISQKAVDFVSFQANTSPFSLRAINNWSNCLMNLLSSSLTSPILLLILNVWSHVKAAAVTLSISISYRCFFLLNVSKNKLSGHCLEGQRLGWSKIQNNFN